MLVLHADMNVWTRAARYMRSVRVHITYANMPSPNKYQVLQEKSLPASMEARSLFITHPDMETDDSPFATSVLTEVVLFHGPAHSKHDEQATFHNPPQVDQDEARCTDDPDRITEFSLDDGQHIDRRRHE